MQLSFANILPLQLVWISSFPNILPHQNFTMHGNCFLSQLLYALILWLVLCIASDGRFYIAGYDSYTTVVTFSVLYRCFVDYVSLYAS